jgi:hypothetical protein
VQYLPFRLQWQWWQLRGFFIGGIKCVLSLPFGDRFFLSRKKIVTNKEIAGDLAAEHSSMALQEMSYKSPAA